MNEQKVIDERKEKFKEFFVKKNLWVYLALIILVILGVYIRSLPMTTHGSNPGLWDITTNSWTLGPDLDPFLFLRYAKEMVAGTFSSVDMMRNVPLGFSTSSELQMVSYMIVATYKFLSVFSTVSVEYAAVVMPVIFFAFTIIIFFLFVREIFIRKDNEMGANIIALLSTAFMIVIPVFLPRTIAGIPEKESIGFFFLFLAFYLFIKAWKSEKIRNAVILGVLAGIATALMGLSWGGVVYIYVSLAAATLIAFILNKIGKKEFTIYTLWLFVSWAITLLMSSRDSLKGLVVSIDTGLAFLVFFILLVDLLVWKTRVSKIKFLQETKVPKNIVSLIIAIIIGVLAASVLFGPGFIIGKISDLNQMLFHPTTGRWSTTVAENRQPYFTEWASSFGPYIAGIPIMFWLFFIGSIVLFKKMLSHVNKNDAWILTGLYILFFLGLVFSRYAGAPALMNGDNFASKFFYYGSAFLLFAALIYYYNRYHKEENKGFEKIDYPILFFFVFFIICVFTARSAVRLIMTLGPVAPILASYLVVEIFGKYRETSKSDENKKMALGIAAIVLIVLLFFCFFGVPGTQYSGYYQQVKSDAYNYVPGQYTFQWQNAMAWVRDNTPTNAVFAHWWDYGYWVQSMGDRATVTDGGNVISFWNYLTGRFVLTSDNQTESLNFLHAHNATNLLIDSSDLSKYGAFSGIGSNIDYDRYSFGPPTLLNDPKNVQETKTGEIRIYQSTSSGCNEEDINYNLNGTKIFLPGITFTNNGNPQCWSQLIGTIIETSNENNQTIFKQATAVYYDGKQQVQLPMRYVYFGGKLTDFGQGIEAVAFITQRISQTSQGGVSVDNSGAEIFVSPRIARGLLGQIYLLNNAFNRFSNFIPVHSEPNLIIASLNRNQQNLKINDFAYVDGQGLLGPIKVWQIQYTGNEKTNPEYIDTDASKYLAWKL